MFDTLLRPAENAGVGVCFTDRLGGVSEGARASLNLGRSDLESLPALRANMAALRAELGIEQVVALHQVHGVVVHDADDDGRDWSGDAWIGDEAPGAGTLPIADAAISRRVGIGLAVRVADCVPVLFADPVARLVGAAHAGRVGLLDGVLAATAEALRRAGAQELQAWIGPHICGDCYEVPAEMAQQAAELLPATRATTSWGTPAIDLGAGAQSQLEALGVRVHRLDPCTMTSQQLFSHRGDGPLSGRQLGLVWLG